VNGASHFTILTVARTDIEADGNSPVLSFVLFPLDMHCCSTHNDLYTVAVIMGTTLRDGSFADGFIATHGQSGTRAGTETKD
jgi:hypothetical protein